MKEIMRMNAVYPDRIIGQELCEINRERLASSVSRKTKIPMTRYVCEKNEAVIQRETKHLILIMKRFDD